MKSVIFLLISSFLRIIVSQAAGYTDKAGNPAPNPCKNGENVYFDTLIFNCIDGKKVYFGCKVNNVEIQQDTMKDENNLRTLYCHKEGSSVKTVVTGCVTDDNQFINDTKTVKQADGTDFLCTKNSNGFSYVKKSPSTKISDCVKGEKKVVSSRYLLECYEESVGYFTFKLAACYATPDDEKSRVEVLKYHDDYVSDDKALGFRYSCHVQGNSYFYDPIGCILGGQFIEPGNIFQNGSLTVMCMRDGPQRLRLRPVYSSGNVDEKACTETKTYIKDNFKYECTPGQQPKPTACIFFKNQKEVPIGATYNDDKAYQYKCEQTSDAKQLALVKTACLDNENQLLFEGGKKTLTDGSRIECQGNTDDGLLRVIVGGKPPIEQCKEGEALIQDYVLYRCKDNQFKPSACAPYNNETTTLMINVTIKVGNYEYKCEEQGKAIIYHAVACLDGDRNLLLPGEKRQVKIFTYECQPKSDNNFALIIYNEEGCKHPAFEETIVCPNSIIDVSNGIKSVEYKSLFKCVLRDDKKYHLIEVGCKVDGKKYDIGDFVVQEKDVYKCVRSIDNEVHLIHVPSYQLTCRFENKVYQNGDEFKSLDGISHYQCIYGTLVKTGCFVHDKRIPANQLMYLNDEPYFCHGKGDGVIPIPFRGCYQKNGKLIKFGESFNEKEIAYICTYTKYENIYKFAIIPNGCVFNAKVIIPINTYILYESKNIVCEVDGSFQVIVHTATPQQEQCIEKTATYNCQSNVESNTESGTITTVSPPLNSSYNFTTTPGNGQGNHGNEAQGSTKSGNGSGNENSIPSDDDSGKTTTVSPQDHTSTGGHGGQSPRDPADGTTKRSSGVNNEQNFPTDEESSPVTSPSHHTAKGEHVGNNSSDPNQGTTKKSDGNIKEQPLPTDENGNPVTHRSDHIATGGIGNQNISDSHYGTTKYSEGNDHENSFPTDENGNLITKQPELTVTAINGDNNHSNPAEKTTRNPNDPNQPGVPGGSTSQNPESSGGNTDYNEPGQSSTRNPNNPNDPFKHPRRTCNSTKIVQSGMWGDPHYFTFDGLKFGYHGFCPYVFVQPCTSISGYEHFSVKVQNRQSLGTKNMANFGSANMEFYGQNIYVDETLEKLYINKVEHGFPYYYPSQQNPKISVEKTTLLSVIIKTVDAIDIQINKRMIDKNTFFADFSVNIPDCPEFFGSDKLCGLAGNYDNNCTNDASFRNGTYRAMDCDQLNSNVQLIINSFGNDWITSDYFTPSLNNNSECSKATDTNVSLVCADGEAVCKPIKDSLNGKGIFAVCKQLEAAVINSRFEGCVSDICVDSRLKCQEMETFVRLCQRQLNGTKLSEWRTHLECPMQCPTNKTYNICVPTCQPSCHMQLAANCSSSETPCVEGCECSVGHVLDKSQNPYRCIKQHDCPPIPTGNPNDPNQPGVPGGSTSQNPESSGGNTDYNEPGQSSTRNPNNPNDPIKPPRRACNSTKIVESGMWGDPHYYTFDGSKFAYHGLCPYVFVQPCTSISGYEHFFVKVQNREWTDNKNMASFGSANMEFYGQNIYVDETIDKLYINKVEHGFPYYYPSQQNPKISVEKTTLWSVIIKTVDVIDIQINKHALVRPDKNTSYADFSVSIPDCPEFFGSDKLCGLAGNYDNNSTNDALFKNGTHLALQHCDQLNSTCQFIVNSFGNDWITSDYFTPSLNNNSECSKATYTNVSLVCAVGEAACKPIKDSLNGKGILAVCKQLEAAVINSRFEGCVSDICVDSRLRCQEMETFVRLCQRQLNGTKLSEWRAHLGCPMQCPTNKTYNICVPTCQPSCPMQLTENCLSSQMPCVEGCECSVGYVLDKSQNPYRCIKQHDCPPNPTGNPNGPNQGSNANSTDSTGFVGSYTATALTRNPNDPQSPGENTTPGGTTRNPNDPNQPGVPGGSTSQNPESSGGNTDYNEPGQSSTRNPNNPNDPFKHPRRTCNSTKIVQSGMWGDPHYFTFDGLKFGYHGFCPYVFVQPCTSISGYEHFSVKVQNRQSLGTKNMANFGSANMEFYGQNIYVDETLEKLYINKVEHGFPYYYPSQQNPKISVEKTTLLSVIIKTVDAIDIQINKRMIDKNTFFADFSVNIPDCPEFFGSDKLCGLAGNYDNNCTNDASFRNGTYRAMDCDQLNSNVQLIINSFGNDWITSDYFTPSLNNNSECSKATDTNVSLVCADGEAVCKPIKDSLNGKGIFAVCKQLEAAVINSRFEGCVSDICVDSRLKCQEMETFVRLCQRQLNGTKLSEWRTHLECPMQCPTNKTYNICVPTCQPSCHMQLAANCSSSETPCVEGCECSVGHVLDKSQNPYRCIKQHDCPPIPTGNPNDPNQPGVPGGSTSQNPESSGGNTDYNEPGQSSTRNPNNPNDPIKPPRRACNSTKIVESGMWGDPHYYTFDGSKFAYHGLCPYVFVQPCTSISGYEHFFVKVQNREWTDNKNMASFGSANMEFYGQNIYVDETIDKLYINKVEHGFPYYYPSQQNPKISVEKTTLWSVIIKTVDVIDIQINKHALVRPDKNTSYADFSVSIPDCPEFFGSDKLCGLAGNYDNNSTNDALFKNGTHLALQHCDQLNSTCQFIVNSFGNDWITSDYFTPSLNNNSECSKATYTNVSLVCAVGEAACKPIKDSLNGKGILAVCKQLEAAVINSRFEGCVSDICVDSRLRCQEMETFVRLCQRQLNGTKLSEWRAHLGCPMQCPTNKTYNICVPTCQPSCPMQLTENCLSSQMPCVEGCECSVGYVLDKSQNPYRCIKQHDCPPNPTGNPNGPNQGSNANSTDSTGFVGSYTATALTRNPNDPQSPGENTTPGGTTRNPNDPNQPGVPGGSTSQNPESSGGNTDYNEPGQSSTRNPNNPNDPFKHPRRTCNSTKIVQSGMWGDPHYFTFDGLKFGYHGFCPYVFVQPCTSISGYEHFSVKVQNRQSLGTKNMANFGSANMEFYGQNIYVDETLEKLYINKVEHGFPYYYPSQQNPKISVEKTTLLSVIIKTVDAIDIQINKRMIDKNTFFADFSVNIPDCPEFFGSDKLCGLAGNYDNNCTNDASFRNGTYRAMDCDQLNSNVQLIINSFGNDWITSDYFTPSLNNNSECSKATDTNVSLVCADGEAVCKPIKDSLNGKGIFAVCKQLEAAVINSRFEGCVSDICVDSRLKCQEMETFVRLCQRQLNGTKLSEWRTHLECPMQCPTNKTYNICVPTCQPSCHMQLAANCSSSETPCVEGCECSVGHVLDKSQNPYRCIKQHDCPPIPTGNPNDPNQPGVPGGSTSQNPESSGGNTDYNEPGQSSTRNPNNPNDPIKPPRRACNSTKIVESGMWGDPHYYTFDGSKFAYHGLCPYVFVQPCTSISGYEHFFVKVQNREWTDNKNMASFGSANMEFYGQNIYVDETIDKLYINKVEHGFPYYYPSQQNPKISVEKTTLWSVIIKTVDVIDIQINKHALVRPDKNTSYADFSVSIPDCPEFFGSDKLCGLAGNYDNNSTNDALFKNGTHLALQHCDQLNSTCQFIVNSFGNDWITSDYFTPSLNNNSECSKATYTNVSLVCAVGEAACKPIKDSLNGKGILAVCKQLEAAVINSRFEGCVSDICVDSRLRCQEMETFVRLCQRQLNGTKLSEWRAHLGCPMQCPTNKTYNICVPTCQPSCPMQLTENCLSSQMPCVEGCECSVGYVLDKSQNPYRCIKQHDCPPNPTGNPNDLGFTAANSSHNFPEAGRNTTESPSDISVPLNSSEECKDLLPARICQQLQPLCLKHSFLKSLSAMANKDDINVLISKIEDAEIKGGNEYLNVLKVLVKNGLYPEEVLTKVILSQFSGTARTSKAECNALREQCQSNNGRLACSNYISKCSDDLNPAFCKAPTTFTPAKELYKTVTAEVISKLCPETCLVQECYKNPEKHGKLDSTNLITPELLTCLLA